VKFDDAKPAPAVEFMTQIKAGDQLRARGTRNADGSELAAEEIVAGSFRNIAGSIKSIDTAANTMTVQDAISKSAVVVKVSPDSQMKKLPAEMAQRIAMRLKSTASGASGDQPAGSEKGKVRATRRVLRRACGQEQNRQRARGTGGNGPPDFQRMLSPLAEQHAGGLQKGDAVMIVSTDGTDSGAVTAITLLAASKPS